MIVTFIMPSVGKQKNGKYVKTWVMEPLGIAALSALTPSGVEKVFFDDRIEAVDYDHQTDLVAINVEAYTAKRAYNIASKFRELKVPVIMGGFHATLMPDEILEHADSVMIGEADNYWPDIVRDASNGSLKKVYKCMDKPDLSNLFPDRSVYKDKKYIDINLVETGRGCKFDCEFCSISAFFNKKYTHRPVEDIIEEIRRIKAKFVFFVDDNIGADKKRAVELFTALKYLNVKWFSQISMHVYQDDEFLSLMHESGCVGVLIGFESLNENILKSMNKNVNQIKNTYSNVIKQFHKHRITIYATFVFGYDDTEESFEEVYRFGIDNKLFYVAFNHLVPFPGTKLYARMDNEGKLLYKKWWLEDNYHFGEVVFEPNNMSAQKLAATCFAYRYKFFRVMSVFKRVVNFRVYFQSVRVLLAYFMINLTANRETKSRSILRIGAGDD